MMGKAEGLIVEYWNSLLVGFFADSNQSESECGFDLLIELYAMPVFDMCKTSIRIEVTPELVLP